MIREMGLPSVSQGRVKFDDILMMIDVVVEMRVTESG
jgi:hypothetical protein